MRTVFSSIFAAVTEIVLEGDFRVPVKPEK